MEMLMEEFYSKNTLHVARDLLGKVIYSKYKNQWLKAQIIETEAYLMEEKGSHSSLGYSEKKKALFMQPGTIYMYYSRGKDSFNISTGSKGDAVLIKSGLPFLTDADSRMVNIMKKLNPINGRERDTLKLCSGQTLIAKSLNIKVVDWDQKSFDKNRLFISDEGYSPEEIITTTRLGIPKGRDEHLFYRYIDLKYAEHCTKNPITSKAEINVDYKFI